MREQFVEFICPNCSTKENIPADIVMHFDVMDGGDPSVPPRFDCQRCSDKMVPVYFVGHTGIIYQHNP